MAKNKRAPANTINSQIRAMTAAATPLPDIPPHIAVRDRDRQFLNVILRSRLREEWTGPDIAVAVQLARVQADIEIQSRQVDAEGMVITDRMGEEKINPRQKIVDQLERRQLALMRSLKLVGTAVGPDKRDLSKQRKLQRQAEEVREGLEDEDLLA